MIITTVTTTRIRRSKNGQTKLSWHSVLWMDNPCPGHCSDSLAFHFQSFDEVNLDSGDTCIKFRHRDGEVRIKSEGCDHEKDIVCAMGCKRNTRSEGL